MSETSNEGLSDKRYSTLRFSLPSISYGSDTSIVTIVIVEKSIDGVYSIVPTAIGPPSMAMTLSGLFATAVTLTSRASLSTFNE